MNNNIAKAYAQVKDYDRAEIYNNAALLEDPSYARAVVRKCELLFEVCEFRQCEQMANWGLKKFADSED